MSMSITQILLVIIAAVLFLAISISWWVLNGNPQAMAMLTGIIPSLNQAEQLSLEQGFKAIHVKIKPEGWLDSELILYEFHPTNEGALGRKHFSAIGKLTASPDVNDYFFLNKFESDKCYLFTTKFKDGVLGYDINSWIYRVDTGSKISKASASPTTLISNLMVNNNGEGCNPQEECSDMSPNEFSVCRDYYTGILSPFNQKAKCAGNDKEKLKEQQFSTSTTDNCVYDESGCPYINGKRDCCAFAKTSSNQHVYEPAYNILCGNEQGSPETRWYACTNNQSATVSANGVQFTCGNDGEWKCKSGCKLDMLNPQVKYEFGLSVIDKTNLEFVLANSQNEEMKNVKVSAKVADSESSVDCFGNTHYADYVDKTTASIAKNGGTFKYSHDNFCYKAKIFDVKVVYKIREGSADVDKTDGFRIECLNAKSDKEDLQKCAATASSSTGFGGSW